MAKRARSIKALKRKRTNKRRTMKRILKEKKDKSPACKPKIISHISSPHPF